MNHLQKNDNIISLKLNLPFFVQDWDSEQWLKENSILMYLLQNSQGIPNESFFFSNKYNHLLSAYHNFSIKSLLLASSHSSFFEKQKVYGVSHSSPLKLQTNDLTISNIHTNHREVVLSRFHSHSYSCFQLILDLSHHGFTTTRTSKT